MLAIFPLFATAGIAESASGSHPKTWVDGMAGWHQGLIVLGSVSAIIIAGRVVFRPC
jgi:CPA2 family monovalent cation:H+ antiporter-2/glutathione-regulated potassium-efflux system protein KefB